MRKAFVVIFEPSHTTPDKLTNLHESIKKDPDVLAWWHYLKNTYILVTTNKATVTSVKKFTEARLPNAHFLVLQVTENNYEGWLPQKAWDWFKSSFNNLNAF